MKNIAYRPERGAGHLFPERPFGRFAQKVPATLLFLVFVLASLWGQFTWARTTYDLRSGRKAGQIDRVTVALEAGGEVIRKVEGKLEKDEMSVVCKLAYDEKTLQVPTSTDARWRSVRYYDKTEVALKVADVGLKPALRPQRRLIAAVVTSRSGTLFSPHGPLVRDELELIDVQGNSLLLDRFLPAEPVAIGQRWEHSADLLTVLLGLDEIATVEVHSTLTKVEGGFAGCELSGRVEGAIYGVTTEVELKAKYRLNLESKRIDWFAMLVKEKRNSSLVADGVDVVARVQVRIVPKAASDRLSDSALKDLSLEPDAESSRLVHESPIGAWQFTHGRSWHAFGPRSAQGVLRLLDRGECLAQCNVVSLQSRAPRNPVPLEKFQEDVRAALGESFGQFVHASQWGSSTDYRVYRVVAEGKTSDLPMRWYYYLIADERGHQMAMSFSVESKFVERFDRADRDLVGSFRFLEPKVASNSEK